MTDRPEPGTLRGWNHVPDVPIQVSPFFAWPPDPHRMFRWISERWFRLAENSILTGLALICWAWFQPSPEVTATLAPGWIAAIWARNMVLMLVVAGGLHWFFHRAKRQGNR